MQADLITMTEVDQGGSVPELKLISKSGTPVLILEGEEVMGAKQNRIIVTTILVAEKGEVIIPVNCTERGRWSYNSPKFRDSGNISSFHLKREMKESVTDSLFIRKVHRADQIKTREKICKSYFIGGFISDRPALPASALKKFCEDFIKNALRLEAHEFKSVGLGTDVRMKGLNMLGSGLVYNDELIHGALMES